MYIYIYEYICINTYMCISIQGKMKNATQSKLSQLLIIITGWRRPIGCLKVQVISHKRAINYMALLRKMTYKDKASYGSSPPCTIKYKQ